MEVKWLMIFCSIVFGAMFAGLAYENHKTTECKVELAKAGKSAAEIIQVCDKKGYVLIKDYK